MITNAQRHAIAHPASRWLYPGRKIRCDRYFGEVVGCIGFSQKHEPVFDTDVPRPRPKGPRNSTLRTCETCARAPYKLAAVTEQAA